MSWNFYLYIYCMIFIISIWIIIYLIVNMREKKLKKEFDEIFKVNKESFNKLNKALLDCPDFELYPDPLMEEINFFANLYYKLGINFREKYIEYSKIQKINIIFELQIFDYLIDYDFICLEA